jgi:hypothetical protein
MREIVLVPTYKRPEHLFCCLKRIREAEPDIPIAIFPDRGSLFDKDFTEAVEPFLVKSDITRAIYVGDHSYHGNSYNVMEAFRWTASIGFDRIYYVEDDVMIHPDFFKWHREQHDERDDIFASMAWVFNRYAPLIDDVMYVPWYYAIGVCFNWNKLKLIAQHACPKYYEDMQGYIERAFPKSNLNSPFGIQHFEQDGLIQRVLDADKGQTATPGITKCSHLGFFGYNRGWECDQEVFRGETDFRKRVDLLEEFIADEDWRAVIFSSDVVEREVGHSVAEKEYLYEIRKPGGFTSEFVSGLRKAQLPRRINGVTIAPDGEIVEKLQIIK